MRCLKLDAKTKKPWTQQDLADQASETRRRRLHTDEEKEFYSAQTVSRLERSYRCLPNTLNDVASALGLDDAAQITRQASLMRWAMMDEITASITSSIGEQTNALRQLLAVLEREREPASAERELLLALMVRRDVTGDVGGALRLGRLLIDESVSMESELDRRIRVRTASVCDHADEVQRGLAVLRPLIQRFPLQQGLTDESWWGHFQQAILLARGGVRSLGEARQILQFIRDNGPTEAHRIAASHQLGVIELRAGRLDRAQPIFEDCLKRRRAMRKTDFRIAYEYGRLSEIWAKRRDKRRATHYRRRAQAVVRRWSFNRYATALRQRK